LYILWQSALGTPTKLLDLVTSSSPALASVTLIPMRAIRIHTPGGPDALCLEDVPVPEPAAGQALVRVEAAGVNFIDVYQRTGFYPIPLPFTLGQEAAGVVERVGEGVTGLRAGDRVAWASIMGACAEFAVVAAARLVPVPEGVSTRQAAAAMLQGMTAHYLAFTTFPLKQGDCCLVHAAAGGVGGLLVQMAKLRGARVIATVGSEAKAAIAREAGADEVILYRSQDVLVEVGRITGGALCQVVYDGVGKDTFDASLSCVAPLGTLVTFGQASGAVPPVDPLRLATGSRFLTRPVLRDYIATTEQLRVRAGDVLEWIRLGMLKLHIYCEYPLAEVASAHRDLEGRDTTGKLILLPG
jgi:NADPH2:quinone reductase